MLRRVGIKMILINSSVRCSPLRSEKATAHLSVLCQPWEEEIGVASLFASLIDSNQRRDAS